MRAVFIWKSYRMLAPSPTALVIRLLFSQCLGDDAPDCDQGLRVYVGLIIKRKQLFTGCEGCKLSAYLWTPSARARPQRRRPGSLDPPPDVLLRGAGRQ